jgi:hypothetical protein
MQDSVRPTAAISTQLVLQSRMHPELAPYLPQHNCGMNWMKSALWHHECGWARHTIAETNKINNDGLKGNVRSRSTWNGSRDSKPTCLWQMRPCPYGSTSWTYPVEHPDSPQENWNTPDRDWRARLVRVLSLRQLRCGRSCTYNL